jgi:hypothetical protein
LDDRPEQARRLFVEGGHRLWRGRGRGFGDRLELDLEVDLHLGVRNRLGCGFARHDRFDQIVERRALVGSIRDVRRDHREPGIDACELGVIHRRRRRRGSKSGWDVAWKGRRRAQGVGRRLLGQLRELELDAFWVERKSDGGRLSVVSEGGFLLIIFGSRALRVEFVGSGGQAPSCYAGHRPRQIEGRVSSWVRA